MSGFQGAGVRAGRVIQVALGVVLGVALATGLSGVPAKAQTVTYTMQTANFNQLREEKNNSPPYAGTYDNGVTELANYANGGSFGNTPGAAAFQTFTTTGNGNTGTVRALQVGDAFTITGYVSANPSVGGYLGISFRDSTSYTNFFSATDSATEARFQLDNTGGWKVYNAGSAVDSGLGANADRTFTITITSGSTFNATVGGNNYYNLGKAAGGGAIDSFAIYTFGDSNQNSFWKNASLVATGTVQLGYAAGNGTTFTPGIITDGLAANSTSTTQANVVFIGGDAGSQVNLTQNNTYTGATTINANATGEAQHANALGSTGAGTTVSSGGVLKLYSPTGISYAAEPLTLNGVGISDGGALLSLGGTNTWNGPITLGSSSRINTGTAGGAGSLTIAGNVSGGANVLFVGARDGADITVTGSISGSGNTQDGTITSLYKDGPSGLTLAAANAYTGDTRLTAGTLRAGSDTALGTGTLRLLGGTITGTGSTPRSFANAVVVGGNVAFGDGTGTGPLAFTGSTGLGGGTRTLTTAVPTTFSGAVTDGSLTKAGAATLSLTNAGNSFGALTVNAGTVSVGATTAITGLGGSGGALELAAGTLTLTAASDQSFGQPIVGAGSLTKAGAAALVLSAANTGYSGTTTLTAGTLRGGDDAAFGTGPLVLNGGTITGTGSAARSFANGVAVGGNVAFGDGTGTGPLAFTGTVGLGGASRTLTTVVSTTFSGVVSDGGITKAGTAALTLSAANTYTGDTRINAGSLVVAAGGNLGNASNVFIAEGASLDVNTSVTVASLQEAGFTNGGTVTIGGGAVLTVNGSGFNVYQDSIGGAGGLAIVGGGTTNLYGTQSYTGTTSVSAGKLSTGVALATSALNVSGGTFEATAANVLGDTIPVLLSGAGLYSLGGSDTIGSLAGTGGTVALGANDLTVGGNASTTYAGALTGSGTFSKGGSGELTLSGASGAFTGSIDVLAGSLALTGSHAANRLYVAAGAALGGSGVLAGGLTGAGLIEPGASPGILTIDGAVTPLAGMSFAFEMSGTGMPAWGVATNSVNDVLRIEAADPFTTSLVTTNTVSVYFQVPTLATGDTFNGGFFVDDPSQVANLLQGEVAGATFQFFVMGDGNGSTSYNGMNYYTLNQFIAANPGAGVTGVEWATVGVASADFAGGPPVTTGEVTQFWVVPEPGTLSLLGCGLATWAAVRRRARCGSG